MRGPLAWPAVPLMQSPRQRFDEAVLDALQAVERHLQAGLPAVEVAVEDVPPSDPAPWEDGVALGRLFPAQDDLPARLVVYRRPVETHAADRADVDQLVHQVVIEQIAQMVGRDPEDLM